MTPDYYKPAYNEEFRTFQWLRPDGQGQLAAGVTLASTTIVCTDLDSGTDTTATMIEQVTVYGSTQTKYRIKGGTKYKSYELEIRAVDSNGQKLADTLIVKIT